MEPDSRIDKTVVRKFKLGEEPNDFAYWQTQPVEKRLEVAEELRRMFYGDYPKRLQRVCTITKRT
jgi:hypothetical protein